METTMDSDDWQPPTEAEMKLIEARRERSDKISKLMSGYLLKGYKMLGVVCSACETILLQDRQGTKYCVACSELDCDTDKDNPVTNQSAAKSMVKEMELSTSPVPTTDTKAKGRTKTSPQGHSQHSNGQSGAEAGRLGPYSTVGEVTPTLNGSGIDAHSWPSSADHDQKEQSGAAASLELHAKYETLITGTDSDSGFPSLSDSRTSSHPQQRKRHADAPKPTLTPVLPERTSTMLSVTRLFQKIDWASKELKDTASIEYSIQLCQLIKTAAEAVVAVRNARM